MVPGGARSADANARGGNSRPATQSRSCHRQNCQKREPHSDAIALLDLLRRIHGGYQDRQVISALFDSQGKRLEGDDLIKVRVHSGSGKEAHAWWYSVDPFDDYQFIRIPVNPAAVIESLESVTK